MCLQFIEPVGSGNIFRTNNFLPIVILIIHKVNLVLYSFANFNAFQKTQSFLNQLKLLTILEMGDILVPRGMWKLFNIFLKQYQKVSIVPYSFDFWLGRNIVVLLDLPKWKKFLLKASTVWMISHTLLCYCFAILKFTRVEIDVVQGSKNDHQFQELRSFVLFTLSMYSSAMIGVSVTTSFTPSVCSKVLNATIKFEEKFNCNKLLIAIFILGIVTR